MNCPSTNRRTVELGGRGVASQLRYQRDHQIDDIYLVLPGPFWVSNNNDTFYKPLKNQFEVFGGPPLLMKL